MKLHQIAIISTILLSSLFAQPLQARKASDLPDMTVEGLQLQKDSKLSAVYSRPGVTLTPYKRIKLLDAAVAFKKNWARDQRRNNSITQRPLNSRQIEEIKLDLAAGFRKIFANELEKAGYDLTDETDDDVLIVRPAIINLDITAPDTNSAARSRTYSRSAGEMTLYVELYDSVTSDLIAKAVDRKIDNANSNFYTWTNSVTNKAAANRIFRGWAQILVNALDDSKTAEHQK